MSENSRRIFDELREESRDLTPERVETLERLYDLKRRQDDFEWRQRWEGPIRFGLFILALGIFCLFLWWGRGLYDCEINPQEILLIISRLFSILFGLVGPGWFLQRVFKHYFSKKR